MIIASIQTQDKLDKFTNGHKILTLERLAKRSPRNRQWVDGWAARRAKGRKASCWICPWEIHSQSRSSGEKYFFFFFYLEPPLPPLQIRNVFSHTNDQAKWLQTFRLFPFAKPHIHCHSIYSSSMIDLGKKNIYIFYVTHQLIRMHQRGLFFVFRGTN